MATTIPTRFADGPTPLRSMPWKPLVIEEWYKTTLGDSDKASDIEDAAYWQGMADAFEAVLALLYDREDVLPELADPT